MVCRQCDVAPFTSYTIVPKSSASRSVECKAGVIGSFPALNARPKEKLDEWLTTIKTELAKHDAENPDRPAAPFAVNQIVHKSNDRLEHDLEACVRHKVPLVITSLGAREDLNAAVHSYGGQVYHDVINTKFAAKAVRRIVKNALRSSSGICSPALSLRAARERRRWTNCRRGWRWRPRWQPVPVCPHR